MSKSKGEKYFFPKNEFHSKQEKEERCKSDLHPQLAAEGGRDFACSRKGSGLGDIPQVFKLKQKVKKINY